MPDGSVVLAIGDEASWTESKHPRGEDGKFTSGSGAGGGGPGPTAKKGQVSNSIAVPLLAHGFKLKKTSGGDAIYEHPETGHEVAVKPVPEGKKYSSGFVVKGGGEGGGGIALEKVLANLGLKGKEKTPKPADVQEALGSLGVGPKAVKSAKPPPSFEHPNPQFQAKLSAFGATPVKATATTQLYSLPNGGSVLIKTKPKMFYGSPTGQYKWKVMNPDGSLAGWNGEGKSFSGLGNKLQNVTGINPTTGKKSVIPPGGATGFNGGSTYMSPGAITPEPTLKYNLSGGKSVVVGQETDSWAITDPNGGVKTGKGQADLDKALAAPASVAMPPAAKVLGNPQTKEAVTFPGGIQQATGYGLATGETVYVANNGDWKIIKNDGNAAFGNGQESLNKEFELLHPRGAGGQFLKKPGEVLPPSQKETANLLESAGAVHSGSSQSGNIHSFKIGEATVTISNGGSFVYQDPKTGIHLSGQGAAVLQEKLSHAGVNFGAASAQQAPAAKPPVNVSKLKNVGPQLGSNPGGQYVDETGQKFYVKKTKSEDHAKNENLAASLYQLAGTNTFQYRKSEDDKNAVITEMVPLQAKQISELTPQQRAAARLDFATHVWTSNWDAAGMTGDNQGVVNGKVTTLDVGGSLAYRAQGGEKGHLFGTEASEWDTLRNSVKNPQTASLFANMTHAELKASVAKVAAVKPDMIREAVKAAGYEGAAATALADKLIARRESVITKLNQEVNKTAPPPPPPPPPEFDTPFKMPDFSSTKMSQLNNAAPEYTSGEHAAIKSYTGGGYQEMNQKLRYGYVSGGATHINQLTKWLDKSSMPEEVVVSRRVDAAYGTFLKDVASHPNAVFTDLGFASTSLNSGTWSGAVQMFIRVPKGAKAAAVQHISSHSSEYEIIVQRGSRYKVVAYDKKAAKIYCELDQTHLVKEL